MTKKNWVDALNSEDQSGERARLARRLSKIKKPKKIAAAVLVSQSEPLPRKGKGGRGRNT